MVGPPFAAKVVKLLVWLLLNIGLPLGAPLATYAMAKYHSRTATVDSLVSGVFSNGDNFVLGAIVCSIVLFDLEDHRTSAHAGAKAVKIIAFALILILVGLFVFFKQVSLAPNPDPLKAVEAAYFSLGCLGLVCALAASAKLVLVFKE